VPGEALGIERSLWVARAGVELRGSFTSWLSVCQSMIPDAVPGGRSRTLQARVVLLVGRTLQEAGAGAGAGGGGEVGLDALHARMITCPPRARPGGVRGRRCFFTTLQGIEQP
jgi:hypothetical protein